MRTIDYHTNNAEQIDVHPSYSSGTSSDQNQQDFF